MISQLCIRSMSHRSSSRHEKLACNTQYHMYPCTSYLPYSICIHSNSITLKLHFSVVFHHFSSFLFVFFFFSHLHMKLNAISTILTPKPIHCCWWLDTTKNSCLNILPPIFSNNLMPVNITNHHGQSHILTMSQKQLQLQILGHHISFIVSWFNVLHNHTSFFILLEKQLLVHFNTSLLD